VGAIAYFYTRDHLGSIREMFTGGGTVVARYDYDPYGRSTTVLGTTPTDFNFTGLYRHSKSNLDLALYRAYDPDLGRWLSRDPLNDAEFKEGPNLYRYVGNSPVNRADPTGLQAKNPTDALGNLLGNTGDSAANTINQEYARGLAACEKIPHSSNHCCKCCVISMLVQFSGPYVLATGGWGKVYDKPCDEVSPEFITAQGVETYWEKRSW
jgi:RHS repeat-associated protein